MLYLADSSLFLLLSDSSSDQSICIAGIEEEVKKTGKAITISLAKSRKMKKRLKTYIDGFFFIPGMQI